MEKSNANIYGSQSGHASTRKILRDVWNSKNVAGLKLPPEMGPPIIIAIIKAAPIAKASPVAMIT